MKQMLIFIVIVHMMCMNDLQAMTKSWAQTTLEEMNLEQKVGQLMFIAVHSNPDSVEDPLFKKEHAILGLPEKENREYARRMIQDHKVGGILFIHMSDPSTQLNLTNELQKLSIIPLMITQDFEWGLSMRLTDTIRFPKNMTLGAMNDPGLVYLMGKEVARQCRVIGTHVNLAPVVDCNTNPANPIIGPRSFGQDPAMVAEYARAMMRGLTDGGVHHCIKHFPGHGDACTDSHSALPHILHDRDHLDACELRSFKQLITSGAQAVMTAHLNVPALEPSGCPTSLSKRVVTDLLQKELGFQGLIFADGLVMRGVTDGMKEDGDVELAAFLAGNDILLRPKNVPQACKKIMDAILAGQITINDLDARVLKILKAKEMLGLHNERFVPSYERISLWTQEALELKRELFARAVTLVKDENILPLALEKSVAVLLVGFENIEPIFSEKLESLLQNPKIYLWPKGAQAKTIEDLEAQLVQHKNVIIGIAGMNRNSKNNFGINDSILKLIKELNSKTTVILSIFGIPYSLRLFGDESAIIMAYEDDPDAQRAAAEVIAGIRTPTGKLPVDGSAQFKMGCGEIKKGEA